MASLLRLRIMPPPMTWPKPRPPPPPEAAKRGGGGVGVAGGGGVGMSGKCSPSAWDCSAAISRGVRGVPRRRRVSEPVERAVWARSRSSRLRRAIARLEALPHRG